MLIAPTPVLKDVVLVGGGHSHVAVLKRFGMRPVPGVRITMVSRGSSTPYSGMLPGLIAGRYTEAEAHIDLVRLCRFAGARFIEAEVCGLDLVKQEAQLVGRPPLAYDIVSLDCGSTPAVDDIRHTGGDLIRVKPIDRFLEQWRRLEQRVASATGPLAIGVVGGGAGGVELILAMRHRLQPHRAALSFSLITADEEILPTHAPAVRRRFTAICRERDIAIVTSTRIVERTADGVVSERGEFVALDEALFVTHASAARWIRESGLAVDDQGFLLVDPYLRSTSNPHVFGAGDTATIEGHARPKSGVFAVRQGRPLADNLRRSVLGRPLRRHKPQRRFLSLIGTGGEHAVASRGRWSAAGAWVFRWKDRIDRAFMRRYQELPPMSFKAPRPVPAVLRREWPDAPRDDEMRCGGCGAKLGADALTQVLGRLEIARREDVVVGLDAPDDAAVIAVAPGKLCVLSVDAFRPIVDDPFVFGEIAANHCLNDLFAVGAEPQSALAIAVLPVWPEQKLVAELYQMLAGALERLTAENAELAGGHTSEGAEVSFGLSVSGLVTGDGLMRKTGLEIGEQLILTKPIGTGTIFAADMRGAARGSWVDAAVAEMLKSNRRASRCLREYGATACTDITGFGLAGHLREMLGPAPRRIALDLGSLPVIAGAAESMARGYLSTLHSRNVAAASGVLEQRAKAAEPNYGLLFDPQTAGGLLGAVPAERAAACVTALREHGYARAGIIGAVAETDGASTIDLV